MILRSEKLDEKNHWRSTCPQTEICISVIFPTFSGYERDIWELNKRKNDYPKFSNVDHLKLSLS